jgi:hypothetical protein
MSYYLPFCGVYFALVGKAEFVALASLRRKVMDLFFILPVYGFPGSFVGNFNPSFVVIVVKMDIYCVSFFGIVGSDGFPFDPLVFGVFVVRSSAFSSGLFTVSAYIAYFVAVIAFA